MRLSLKNVENKMRLNAEDDDKELIVSTPLSLTKLKNGMKGSIIVSVTKNSATKKEFANFKRKIKEKDSKVKQMYSYDRDFNENDIKMNEDAYELWLNNKLIGYCLLKIDIVGCKDYWKKQKELSVEELKRLKGRTSNSILVNTELEYVYLLCDYRYKRLGLFFANEIKYDLLQKIKKNLKLLEEKKYKKMLYNASASNVCFDIDIFFDIIHSDIINYMPNFLKNSYKMDFKNKKTVNRVKSY